jgi:DNA-binding response OmpR family regulator
MTAAAPTQCCPTCHQPIAARYLWDFQAKRLLVVGREILFDFSKAVVLDTLLASLGRAVPRERLYVRLWGVAEPDVPENTFRTHICKIRRALADTPLRIETVWGEGYMITWCDDRGSAVTHGRR